MECVSGKVEGWFDGMLANTGGSACVCVCVCVREGGNVVFGCLLHILFMTANNSSPSLRIEKVWLQ